MKPEVLKRAREIAEDIAEYEYLFKINSDGNESGLNTPVYPEELMARQRAERRDFCQTEIERLTKEMEEL